MHEAKYPDRHKTHKRTASSTSTQIKNKYWCVADKAENHSKKVRMWKPEGIRTPIHPFSITACPALRVGGEVEPVPGAIWQSLARTSCQSMAGLMRRDRQARSHPHLKDDSESRVNLTILSLHRGGKPECTRRTHAGMERTIKVHTERPPVRALNLSPWSESTVKRKKEKRKIKGKEDKHGETAGVSANSAPQTATDDGLKQKVDQDTGKSEVRQ